MAVTQQLARVTREHLATCSRSVDVLDRLCSFDGPDEDYLDLNWAPRYIARAITLSGSPAAEVALLDLAWAGAYEVNPSYREPFLPVMEAPRAIGPDDVPAVARRLASIDINHTARAISTDPAQAERELGFEAPTDPRGYIADHFHALRDFYVEAAGRRLAVVVWSD